MRLFQIGAGNIGRGYMAQLFWEAGYELSFADVSSDLVARLNEAGGYDLRILDAYAMSSQEMRIEPVRAVQIADGASFARELTEADVVATAVGVPNLPKIGPALAAGLLARFQERPDTPLDIYLCENTLTAGSDLRAALMEAADAIDASGALRTWAAEAIGFVGTSVARMVPLVPAAERRERPLLVVADAYRPLPYDDAARKDAVPSVPEFRPRTNFAAEVARKLFLYNMCHASLAYLGRVAGLTYVHETLAQPELRTVFVKAAQEIGDALEREFPDAIRAEDNAGILEDILVRYANPMLKDSIARVGRDPMRKLGRSDRLIGAAELCLSHGIEPVAILTIVSAAYRYRDPEDAAAVRLADMSESMTTEALVAQVSGLTPGEPIYQSVVRALGARPSYAPLATDAQEE